MAAVSCLSEHSNSLSRIYKIRFSCKDLGRALTPVVQDFYFYILNVILILAVSRCWVGQDAA